MKSQNNAIRRNALIFAIFTLIIHILACFMFGFFFNLPTSSLHEGYVQTIFIAFAHGVFVVVGFGLLFSYLRKMIWTGMGFTLLITALSVEMYFMMNAFWTKATIQYSVTPHTDFKDNIYNFFLTNTIQSPQLRMATITGAFRCALSNIIAFSSIMGRAGPLQALFVSIFGTIGYQLNRQIIQNYSDDSGGTSSIFVFGGFMGLIIGILKHFVSQRNQNASTKQHENYTANRTSASFALMGTLLIWIFFPVLALDYINSKVATHTPYTGAYSVIFSLCAATITSLLISPIMNDGVLIRDVVYGPIAGGVACSTASYWILNPAFALVIGVVAAILQVVIMNVVEKKIAREKQIYHTFSFTLFGAQGLLGAIFAAIWNAAVRSQTYDFQIAFRANQVFSWIMSLISLPLGILFGAFIGLLCILVSSHRRMDHFDDFTYWANDDGMRIVKDLVDTEMDIKQKNYDIKGKRAYL